MLEQPKAIDHNSGQHICKGYSFNKAYVCVCGKEIVVNLWR